MFILKISTTHTCYILHRDLFFPFLLFERGFYIIVYHRHIIITHFIRSVDKPYPFIRFTYVVFKFIFVHRFVTFSLYIWHTGVTNYNLHHWIWGIQCSSIIHGFQSIFDESGLCQQSFAPPHYGLFGTIVVITRAAGQILR